ncbi:MAG TPA: M20 family metallopeptidase, partial [Planctomycetota bacterium]|nr:M20 family metallopeptidase [Planctomycetota bacterium]
MAPLDLVGVRRDLHRHPELSMRERRTAGVVERALRGMGLRPRRCAGTGVLAEVRGPAPGPTILLRADMDALPIQEVAGRPHGSRNPGVMHACGHDGHTAILLGAAERLAVRPPARGRVRLCFQPGEEGADGARAMVRDGALKAPVPDAAAGLHLWSHLPSGKAAVLDGPCMAAVDRFVIRVHGKGGHAAYPHAAVDPVVAAAQIVVGLQSLVSRRTDPRDSAVVTVGRLSAGSAFNVIPPVAEIEGTVRTYRERTRRRLARELRALASSVARGFGARAEVEHEFQLPPTVNDAGMAALAREAAIEVLGRRNVVPAEPSMGGEDVGVLFGRNPGVFLFLGCRNAKRGIVHEHHHP